MTAMPAADTDVVVIGAGIVGLAVAAELARTQSVVVVERHESYARETSSHNSGVIHSGLYYATGSLKHTLCLAGNPALYEWCEAHGVPARRTGKLIVAVADEEIDSLAALERQGRANEVRGLELLSGRQARALEPSVPARAALFSHTSGIVDQMAFARSLEAAARERNAIVAYRHEVLAATRETGLFHLEVRDPGGAIASLQCAVVVNAASHGAPAIAEALGYPLDGAEGMPTLRQYVSRGRYYDVVNTQLSSNIHHLIYPLPEPHLTGLGVHVTMDIDGTLHLGPDAEWMTPGEALNYHNDDSRRAEFLTSAKRLLPELRDQDITPGQVGYRPKLNGPDEAPADFLLWHDRGYVHLGGIESPGLTASIPIALEVASMLH